MSEDQKPILLRALDRREISRRRALQLLAAGLAASQAACLRAPGADVEGHVEAHPTRPTSYATAMLMEGLATGLVALSHDGRPTKLDGNPAHPASLGGTMPQHQAALFDLYDPQRAKAVTRRGQPSSYGALERALSSALGRPLWLILPEDSSPLHRALLERLRAHRGADSNTRVVRLAAGGTRASYRGSALWCGRALEPQFAFDRAEVVVSLDHDFVQGHATAPRWARDFFAGRAPDRVRKSMNRLFVAESMLTPTGSMADLRVAMPASDIAALTVTLSEELRSRGKTIRPVPSTVRDAARARTDALGARPWLARVAAQLMAHAGRSLVIVGERQPAFCHALVYQLNAALGNLGTTLHFSEPARLDPLGAETLEALAQAIQADQVGCVAVIDCNPIYQQGPDSALKPLLGRVPCSLHLSSYRDETSDACTYHVPLSHFLESWGDARAGDGTVSLVQPLIRPLYESRSQAELLGTLAGISHPQGKALLQQHWRETWGVPQFAERWSSVLARGVVEGSALSALAVSQAPDDGLERAMVDWKPALRESRERLELDIAPSPSLRDGRFSQNAWLQELPHPIVKLTWTQAAFLGTKTAQAHGIQTGQVVELEVSGRTLKVPALVVPGHAEGCLTLEEGYGRHTPHGPIADGVGVNIQALRSAEGAWQTAVTLRVTDRHEKLPITQGEQEQHDRGAVRTLSLTSFLQQAGASAQKGDEAPPSMHEGWSTHQASVQWAMSIDTTLCTACGSCVVACQAENNTPVVGAEGVRNGREMHWLRIDTYHLFGEAGERQETVHQPMACQHCEHAPCEYVCPVFATQHSPDGLNEMVYNRCVGTRFCSNNCPYKVRRFNWFNYTAEQGSLALQHNPEVTVRERGVMEKCTYCVQRIRGAEICARIDKRPLAPGEVVTACQQACPTQAIQFGALEHTQTAMVSWRSDPRCYGVLEELGTRPRTLYLAKLSNPPREGDDV